MQAILVRIGVDLTFGRWNAPVDPRTNAFVYVPIPEKPGTAFHPACERPYTLVEPALQRFAADSGCCLHDDLGCPRGLLTQAMHLDPDFSLLTYGDVGARRGSQIRQLVADDVLVFYAGLRPTFPCEHKLVYALIGLYVVQEVVQASTVPRRRWHENAHTRKVIREPSDIVVRAKPGISGRLKHAIPIGEFRDHSYRVRRDLLTAWGGLSVNDGYIQRSARPPRFLKPQRFMEWFEKQGAELLAVNNPDTENGRM
jgi:hypothetical protein